MIKLKQQYNKEISKMINRLVDLGYHLYECHHINEKLTSSEYKQQCIDTSIKEIDNVKIKLMDAIISLADQTKLDISLQV